MTLLELTIFILATEHNFKAFWKDLWDFSNHQTQSPVTDDTLPHGCLSYDYFHTLIHPKIDQLAWFWFFLSCNPYWKPDPESHSPDRNLLISGVSVSLPILHLFFVVPTAFFNIGSFLPGFLNLIPCLGNNSISSMLILFMVSFPKINLALYQILCLWPLELISIVWEWANCAWGVNLSKEILMLSYFFWKHLTS